MMISKKLLFVLCSFFFGSEILACTLDQICNDPHCSERKKRESLPSAIGSEPPAKRARTSESGSLDQPSLIQDILSDVMAFQPGARKKLVEQIEKEKIALQSGPLTVTELEQIEPWLLTESTSGPYQYCQNLLLDYYETTGKMDKYFSLIVHLGFELSGTRADLFWSLLDSGYLPAEERFNSYIKELDYKKHNQEIKSYLIRNTEKRKKFLNPLMEALFRAQGVYQDLSGTVAMPFVSVMPSQRESLFAHIDPSINLLIGAHFLSKPEMQGEGKKLLSWTLQNLHSAEEYKIAAIVFLIMAGHEFSPMETIGFDIQKALSPSQKVLLAANSQVLDLSSFNKATFNNLAINLDRLSDPEPNLDTDFDDATENQFRILVKDIITADIKNRLGRPLSETEQADTARKIDKALKNFERYLRAPSSFTSDKAKYVAHYLATTESTATRNQEIISIMNGDSRSIPGSSLNQSFNRILTHLEERHQIDRFPFHPFVDASVRRIKWFIVRDRILENRNIMEKSPFNVSQQPNPNLFIGMREILGNTLGFQTRRKLIGRDPLNDTTALFITDNFEKVFNIVNPIEWKHQLLKEFFFCYTPKYLIDEFRKIANLSINIDQMVQIFQLIGLPIEPSYIDQNTSKSPQLTENGAVQILLNYGYLTKTQNE